MKNLTKKLIGLICAIAMTTAVIPASVSAARVGDVIGYAKPTDIVATINGYQLESYNVNNYTYICVEDLRYYGFEVEYDNYSRALYVSRQHGGSYTQIDPQNTNPGFWSIGNNNTTKKILHTDIVTYLDGYRTESRNIGGQTIINFDSLARFGAVSYDNDLREISLKMDGVNSNPLAEIAAELTKEYYNSDWKGIYRAKGDLLMFLATARTFANQTVKNDYINNKLPSDKRDLQEFLDILKQNGLASSIYCEVRNSNGAYITSFQLY